VGASLTCALCKASAVSIELIDECYSRERLNLKASLVMLSGFVIASDGLNVSED
jgi:hypothetical protein